MRVLIPLKKGESKGGEMELLVDILNELAEKFGKDNAWMLTMKERIENAMLSEGWRLSVPYEAE